MMQLTQQQDALVEQACPGSKDHDELVRRIRTEAKRRLARELHDSVAQTLTVMVVQMEHLKLDVAGQQALVPRIDRLQGSAREVLTRLRQALYELREESAADTGFVTHLRALLDRLERTSDIRTSLRVSAGWPSRLSWGTAHQLRSIVVQALDHVAPHSAVVEVYLGTGGGHMVLQINADGGRKPASERHQPAGLVGLRERTALLGGRLRVTRSHRGRGSTVRVSVPVRR